MTGGKKYWSDGSVVAGQQFEYTFDDIGNRISTRVGGDQYAGNLRGASYSANSLNQYTSRTVPGYLDVMGSAVSNATVTLNLQSTYRKGEYFRKESSVDNSSAPVWQPITNIAVRPNGASPDYVTTNTGNMLLAKASETFLHDANATLSAPGGLALNNAGDLFIADTGNNRIRKISAIQGGAVSVVSTVAGGGREINGGPCIATQQGYCPKNRNVNLAKAMLLSK